MKKLFILILLGAAYTSSPAQIFGIGYNMNFTGLEGMNYVVSRYNETRSFLDKTMDDFTFMDGFTMNLGFVGPNGIFAEVGMTKAVKKHTAEGVDNTQSLVQRQLRVAVVDWQFGLGIAFPLGETGGAGFGVDLGFGRFKVKTRVDEKSVVNKADWIEVMKEPILRPSIFFRIQTSSPGLCIEPYFNLKSLTKVDVTPVNQAINPVTSASDPSPLDEPLNTFGIRVKFGVVNIP